MKKTAQALSGLFPQALHLYVVDDAIEQTK